jgi:DNA-binding GntR family transcriptional regulator
MSGKTGMQYTMFSVDELDAEPWGWVLRRRILEDEPMPERQIRPVAQPIPLREQVREQLEDFIIYGTLPQGHHLVESRLARQLGVSRIPVREALQRLSQDGWVDLRPRQGAFVHRPSAKEVDDVFAVRTLVEFEAARLAAQNATDDAVRRLRELLEAGAETVGSDDERALLRANESFHEFVTEMADNRALTDISALLGKRIRWYFATVVTVRSSHSWEEHRELVDAIAARDPQCAAEVMRRHIDHTRTAYHEYLERQASGPPFRMVLKNEEPRPADEAAS